MPCRHVPEKNGSWLKGCDLSEQKENPAPLRPLPGDVSLNEEKVRRDRAKSAERSDKPDLTDSFAHGEVERNGKRRTQFARDQNVVLYRQLGRAAEEEGN